MLVVGCEQRFGWCVVLTVPLHNPPDPHVRVLRHVPPCDRAKVGVEDAAPDALGSTRTASNVNTVAWRNTTQPAYASSADTRYLILVFGFKTKH
jgi:hypothetical protein